MVTMAIESLLVMLMALSGCNSYHLQLTNNWTCSQHEFSDYYNLSCDDSNHHLINIYFIEHTLHITHDEGLIVIDLTTFPKLRISQELRDKYNNPKLREIKIKNCALPDGNISFGTLFEHLGIENVILSFEGINISPPILFLGKHFSSGLEKVENLTLHGNSIKQLSQTVFQSIPELINLNLSENNIVRLHQNVFESLKKLETLNLSSNKLTSLSVGMFKNQRHLTVLCIQRNRLTTLTTDMFRGLKYLSFLHLEGNNVPRLTGDVFHNLPMLRQISLGRSNGSMKVPYAIFGNQNILECVFLERVKIAEGLHLSGLKILEIKSSEVINISGLSNIEKVSIIQSKLEPLNVTSLKNFNSTTTLCLSYNKITNLEDGLFDGLTELTLLNVSNNHLTNVSELVFRELHNLTEIDLSNNRLTTIHPNAFGNNKRLITINLQNNQLAFRDDKTPFKYVRNLKFLNLSNNNSTRTSHKLNRLKEVNLVNNQIPSVTFKEIQQNFINLRSTSEMRPTLKRRVVRDTRIYQNKKLINCDCDVMVGFLWGSDDAQHAAVRRNCAELSSQSCSAGSYSRERCPSGCTCEELTNNHLSHVVISCKDRQLTRLPEIEIKNVNSIGLDISHNSLKELPYSSDMLSVVFIRAPFNQIEKVGQLPPALRGLDLSHNKIRTIAADVIRYMKNSGNLEILFLKENPLECSCFSDDLEQSIQFIDEKSLITDLLGAKCDENYEFSMLGLHKKCKYYAIMGLIVTILIIISLVILLLFIKYHQFIKMWLYCHGWFLWWIDEEYMDRDKVHDVFISYADENKMLAYRITHALEKDDIFKVCLHERDFIAGERIEDSVQEAVRNSRRTLVILSENYLTSVRCEHEFHLAWDRSVSEKQKLIIAVTDGSMGEITDKTIHSYVKAHTCIESRDKWFWERLIFRLPLKTTIKNIFPIREWDRDVNSLGVNKSKMVNDYKLN